MDTPILRRGIYLGRTVQVRSAGGVALTLARYQPNQHHAAHVHELPGLFLLLEGDHRETRAGDTTIQQPASVLYHSTRVPHATDLGPRGMVGLNISFDTDWLASCGLDDNALSSSDCHEPSVTFAALRLARVGLSNASSDMDVENGAIETISEMAPGPRSYRRPHWLSGAVEAADAQFREAIGLSWLARKSGVTPVHLARVFRLHKGCSVQVYLQRLRLIEALRLASAGESLGMAAALAGFTDQSHLTRIAAARLGVTPAAMIRLFRR